MTPLERYQHDLDEGLLQPDAAQAEAVQCLQKLYEELVPGEPVNNGSLLKKLFKRQETAVVPKGLYFWGGVGRGKTYLMDAS